MWCFYSYLSRIKIKYLTSLHLFLTKSTKYYHKGATEHLTDTFQNYYGGALHFSQ